MITKTALSAVALSALVVAGPAAAHHAVNAQFDVTKNIPMTAVLTKVELINPHTYMHFMVKDASGKSKEWSMETGAPASLKRAGLSVRDSMKVGSTYKLVISPSRNGSPVGLMHAITLPDGKFIAFGGATNVDAARELHKQP